MLAGGFSSRIGQDKSVLELAIKSLIKHVVDAGSPVANETVIINNSQERATKYAKIAHSDATIAVDVCESRSPLIETLTSFGAAHGKYSLLLPFDTPFLSLSCLAAF